MRNLPQALETATLQFLDLAELEVLALLSKDCYRLVCALLRDARTLFACGSAFGVGLAVRLCRSLRRLVVLQRRQFDDPVDWDGVAAALVRRNGGSLESIELAALRTDQLPHCVLRAATACGPALRRVIGRPDDDCFDACGDWMRRRALTTLRLR